MKKLFLGLIISSIISHITFSMEESPNETQGHIFSKLDPELQPYVIEQGIQSILNSNSDPIQAIIDASKYLYNATSANKFLLSKKAELENKLKLWAKKKFAPEYAGFSEEELNLKIKAAANDLIANIPYRFNYSEIITSDVNRNNIVKLILAGANPNEGGFNRQIKNLLGLALKYHDTDLIRLLLLYKANANNLSTSDNTPLIATIMNNISRTEPESYEIAKLLISNGANVNLGERMHGWSPLQYTAIYKRPQLTKLLIDHGAIIEYKDKNGKTALDFAKLYGAHEVEEILSDELAKQNSIV